jgi:hypothetical protein
MTKKIEKCRVSGSSKLVEILDLGVQSLSGVFPRSKEIKIEKAPLKLLWCEKSKLVQLAHSVDLIKMYGDNYGYRSGLNTSMVKHLKRKIKYLEDKVSLQSGDLVIDIGSNDATSLKSYNIKNIDRVGVDPTGEKFKKYYTEDIKLVSDFFPSINLKNIISTKKAKIITSIAMFYDLENPQDFVDAIKDNLHKNGVWHLEQSYLPLMIENNAYDTVCHEHLEYYTFESILFMLEKSGLKVVEVEKNYINGGSFALSVAHKECNLYNENKDEIAIFLNEEKRLDLSSLDVFFQFKKRVADHKKELRSLILNLISNGKKVFGYGASTKGNVLLQYCEFTDKEINYIAEVNEDKFGCYTPGTDIPIISQKQANKMFPDYYLVLPWHFKDSILKNEKNFLESGGQFIFPMPNIEII